MWQKGARATLAVISLFLAACGAKTLDFSNSDAGSGGATGGGAGTGGGPYFTRVQAGRISKIDLLFMIDNSSSMADKQQILGEAVPELVDRLIEPLCIDPVTLRIVGEAVNGVCLVGELAFEPVKDIHIGIISSSLGNHGASGVCEDAIDVSLGRSDPHNDDRAHLITRGVGSRMVPTFSDKGFLYYNPSVSGALTSAAAVATPFMSLAQGVGQHGCGYEASLESVYRFLVDPDPYDTIRVDKISDGIGVAVLEGTDRAVLQQRADFLRPDSLVSVMIMTDENDCSLVDGGQGFYALLPPMTGTGKSVLKHGTAACIDNPNDPCCYSCSIGAPPAGCPPREKDQECMKGELLIAEDQPRLRCFDQKRRYGADFLYPVQRYIDGFTRAKIPNRQLEMVDNPLFSDLTCPSGRSCTSPRDKSHVFVTGIVGVPWQDIAIDPSDLTKGYKTAGQLTNENVWANIVGDPLNPSGPVPPRDMHMVESIAPRPGLAGPASPPQADPIHGHEWDPSKNLDLPNADLQYACIFDLAVMKTCTESSDCDCFGPHLADVMKPVCQNAQGMYTTTQSRAKAYPGTRILQVLQGIGDQAIVGSICPAQSFDRTREDYGYSPVLRAVTHRLSIPLAAQCVPVALPIDATSRQTPCAIIEVSNDPSCNCDNEPGRRTASTALLTDEMKAQGACRCEIMQLGGDAQTLCRSEVNPPASVGHGWCYVAPDQLSDAACNVARGCPIAERRLIRYVTTTSEPRLGATAYFRCEVPPVPPPTSTRCP